MMFLVYKGLAGKTEPLVHIVADNLDAATDYAIKRLGLETENHDLDCVSDHTTVIETHDDIRYVVVEEGFEGYDTLD